MLSLLAALTFAHQPVWWSEFKKQLGQCGLVYNVDGHGPPGDGVLIENDYSGLILSRSATRPQKPIKCIADWAKKRRIKVRYSSF